MNIREAIKLLKQDRPLLSDGDKEIALGVLIKFAEEIKCRRNGHSGCKCCELKYWKGNILDGFTITSIKKNGQINETIHISLKEIPKLLKIAKKIYTEDIKELNK